MPNNLDERVDDFTLWSTKGKSFLFEEPMVLEIIRVKDIRKDMDYYVSSIKLYSTPDLYEVVKDMTMSLNDYIGINGRGCFLDSVEDQKRLEAVIENTLHTEKNIRDSNRQIIGTKINFTPNPYTRTNEHTPTTGCAVQAGCATHPFFSNRFRSFNNMNMFSALQTNQGYALTPNQYVLGQFGSTSKQYMAMICKPVYLSTYKNNNQNACVTRVVLPNYTNNSWNTMPASPMNFIMPGYHTVGSGMLSDMHDDVIELMQKEILKLNNEDIKKYLKKIRFDKDLLACYEMVFDLGWDEEFWNRVKNNYTLSVCKNYWEFSRETSGELKSYLEKIKTGFKECLEHVHNYDQKVYLFDKISRNVLIDLQKAARNVNLQRLKNVLGIIFDECEESARAEYIRSTNEKYPNANSDDLYQTYYFPKNMQLLRELKESLLSDIDLSILDASMQNMRMV